MNKYILPVIVGLALAFLINLGLGALNAYTVAHGGASSAGVIWFPGPFIGFFVAYLMANLAGNRKVATADAGAKTQALQMTPPAGKALVFVMRKGFVGKAAGMNVLIDETPVAQLKSPRFSAIAVPPGRHVLAGRMGGLAGPQNKDGVAEFIAEPGQVLVYEFGISMGALQNAVTVGQVRDLQQAKATMTGMKMTVADKAEV